MVASNVPNRRGLLFYSWLPTGHRSVGSRSSFAHCDTDPRAVDAVRRIAYVSPCSDRESARRGLDCNAHVAASLVAGKTGDSCAAWFCSDRFHHHHYTFLADATAHIIENPFAPHFFHGQAVAITLILIALLGVVFLKGFTEAIGIAVGLTRVYLLLNAVVLAVAFYQVARMRMCLWTGERSLFTSHASPLAMVGVSLLLFPKLALGLSGFETGVAVMPLVKGSPEDTEQNPAGRIRHTRRLLLSAALIMSVFLIASSLVTTLLIPSMDFRPASDTEPAGPANGRALAYLAHRYLGDGFGTLYDVSTILILWFAGASAMAGLLNIVPRYLPRYGMAPEWAVLPARWCSSIPQSRLRLLSSSEQMWTRRLAHMPRACWS